MLTSLTTTSALTHLRREKSKWPWEVYVLLSCFCSRRFKQVVDWEGRCDPLGQAAFVFCITNFSCKSWADPEWYEFGSTSHCRSRCQRRSSRCSESSAWTTANLYGTDPKGKPTKPEAFSSPQIYRHDFALLLDFVCLDLKDSSCLMLCGRSKCSLFTESQKIQSLEN